MKLRFDTYTKNLDAATEAYNNIMSKTKCDDLSLHYNGYSYCYNLMGTVSDETIEYVADLLNSDNWKEEPNEL